jgi:hypothetical protein
LISTATRLRHCQAGLNLTNDATALRLANQTITIPRVAEAATLGFETQPRCG